ncbi:unnamed protein product [Closterium sp. NIES-65]|nr:unnamed protein product [Closterium sp. NIES-65]
MTKRTLELVVPVAPQHRLDEVAVLSYLKQHVRNVPANADALKISQFGHGQSNPTYLLEVSSAHHGSQPARFVLRKKPPGHLLKSAHAVEREFQVLAALGSQAGGATVPVPAVHALCTDPSVIGTPFYIMDFVPGRIFTNPCLPVSPSPPCTLSLLDLTSVLLFFLPHPPNQDLPPAARTQIYTAMAGTLAALHSARLPQLQKDGFGRPDSYCRRQVERWAKQYEASMKSIGEEFREEDGRMRGLIAWLRENVPGEDAAAEGVMRGVVHGDFRLDNLVFHPTEPRVVAVLDWELSTLGNQMSDVAYCCLPYHLPPSQPGAMLPSLGITQLPGGPPAGSLPGGPPAGSLPGGPPAGSLPGGPPAGSLPAGIPSEAQFVRAYCHEIQRLQGVSLWPGDTWRFYVALSLFRGAAIFTGIYQRALQGNASSSRAGQAGRQVAGLIACALHVVHSPPSIPARPPQGSSSISGSSGAVGIAGGWDGSSAVPASPSHPVGLAPSPRAEALRRRVAEFVTQEVLPIEGILEEHAVGEARWTIHPLVEKLKGKAKQAGLWNLWIPALDAGVPVTPVLGECQSRGLLGAGLSNLDYAHVCKEMGKSVWAPELFNCSAPDTGNMEVLLRYGNEQQQREWLVPLLEGKIRSCFAMTEPRVASSDATNIEARIESAGDHYILHGHKWWASGASDPRCKVAIFMGKHPERAAPSGPHSAPAHRQQSMLLVPMSAPGVTVVRPLLVFGYDDAPHGHSEVLFEGVKVPKTSVLLGEGRGFEIAQGRLGPGRLHHCMRLIGATERAMDCMLQRALSRVAFGRPLGGNESVMRDTAECRITLEAARLLVLQAAAELDAKGNKEARIAIAMAKVAAPRAAQKVLDRAIQVHGGGGVSSDFPLARLWTAARTLRIADGPDEVHLASIGKKELRDWQKRMMGGGSSGSSGNSGASARL